MTNWLIFLYALPAGRGSQRVGLWRNLRKLGAVPLKTSAFLLPDKPEHFERLQWLAQQLRDGGGDANLIRTPEIDGLSERRIRGLFHEARAADYQELIQELTALLRANRRKIRADLAASVEKMRTWLADIRRIDFFDCPRQHDALMLIEKAGRLGSPPNAVAALRVKRSDYRNRTWLTRPRPEIDRVASAWLIKRCIDPGAKFVFAARPDDHPNAVTYDLMGAEFTHHGDDCTFETLLKRFALEDKALQRIAEMVHHADLADGKFPAVEAEGMHAMLKGLGRLGWSDDKILQHGLICFDALRASLEGA